MAAGPIEVTLAITPRSRFEIIDVSERIEQELGKDLGGFRKAQYCSLHTTAGYLEQGVCARLGHSPRQLDPFFRLIQRIFPPDAGYSHDRIQLREELTEHERAVEPPNADSHLAFISAGLKNCVTYIHKRMQPVYFIELDGIYKERRRERKTAILAYNGAEIVRRERIPIPISANRAIESLNLSDARFGLFEQLAEWVAEHGVEKGRFDVRLAPEEHHVGLTVNEYETLLMRNDLPEVLSDPLKYMVDRGRKLLRYPGAIPGKTRDYAAYDLIHLYNELLDTVPAGRWLIDRIVSVLSSPASRFLRLKRHISLPVSNSAETGPQEIVLGRYQSPILIQHHPATNGTRFLDITLRRFT
jgi:thiamine phosphate synthase YjbQ (UPF0047 family)